LWSEYVAEVGPPAGVAPGLPWLPTDRGCTMDLWQARRWAHTAKRSRWPLMRNVVAESLRCLFEPQELDRVPLPDDPEDLFELVCMVRILKALEGEADLLRWLDRTSGNRVDLSGLSYSYQKSLLRNVVLGTPEFLPEARLAIERHRVGVPQRIDGWVKFAEPRRGFHGILVEAKSGSQSFEAGYTNSRATERRWFTRCRVACSCGALSSRPRKPTRAPN
jgi:hypothetical protein